jgi:pyruvate formate lyase activating enzyme
LPFADCVLYDLKIFNSDLHQKYTGQPNELILDNLLHVAAYIRKKSRDLKLWLRTPLIPGATATEENITEIGRFLKKQLSDVVEFWELCAF